MRLIIERKPQIKEFLDGRIQASERELERQRQLAERRGRPALLDISGKSRLGERILPRFALVEQAEEADCGAACLAMICKQYGVAMTLGKLRDMAKSPRKERRSTVWRASENRWVHHTRNEMHV